jgi:hypothetical protein
LPIRAGGILTLMCWDSGKLPCDQYISPEAAIISTFGSGENEAYNPYPWALAANKKANHPDHGIPEK